MQFSVDIPDKLFQKAKLKADKLGISMQKLIIQSLHKILNGDEVKPDPSRLPKLPIGSRRSYSLDNDQIQALFASEECKWHGGNR